MLHKHTVEIEWAGRPLKLETGRIARQSDGAVLAQYGGTSVLATATAAKEPKPDIDFFPLTVNYQEKTFAAGKIPGGYFKREGRPTEKETLTSRLIDRPIRPLFASGFKHETQVIATVLSHDMENDPDVVAMIATSAALTLSGIPFLGPLGAARVGYIGGNYVLNPMIDDMSESALDLVVAGTASAVLMVESEAKELQEDVMLGAVMFGQKHFQPVLDAIVKLAERAAKEPWKLKTDTSGEELAAKVRDAAEADLREAYKIAAKHERRDRVGEIKEKAVAALVPEGADVTAATKAAGAFKELEKDVVRSSILSTKHRIDGRDLTTVRPIVCEVGILPRTHGSALFTRGETQALWWRRSAPARTSNISMRWRAPIRRPSCCITISRPTRSVKLAAWAHRGAARSATVSLRGGLSIPSCRTARLSPIPSAWSRRSPSRTARPLWPRCADRRLP